MKLSEIKAQAPEGAQSYIDGSPVRYFMYDSSGLLEWSNECWTQVNRTMIQNLLSHLKPL